MTRSRLRDVTRLSGGRPLAAASVPLAAALVAAMPTTTLAQTQNDDVLENIIVTAQKRTENIQDVPVSIQAIGTERLEELHIADFEDYAKFLPSVNFQTLGPGFARVYMRGVASGGDADGNHSGSLPSVGTYLDEQPITTIQGNLDVHLYDIERVESLAGPQGTLYGASSQAGTVRIITNKPNPDAFTAAYDLEGRSVSGGDQGYTAEGFANIPLTSSAAIRLVGWTSHDPGYVDNVFREYVLPSTGLVLSNAGHEKDNYNDVDTYGARAALKVDLNDSWSITPSIMAQEQKGNGLFAYDRNLGELKVSHRFPEDSKDRWAQAALTVEGKISNFDLVYAGSYLNRKVDVHQDYADYAYWYDVDYAAQGGSFASYFYDDAGDLVDPSQFVTGKDRYTKESHELRISTPGDFPLRFVGGVFAQRQVHGIEQRYQITNLAASLSVTDWPNTLWLTEQERIDRDSAVFGELSYDITPSLTITGGLRYFEAENSLIGFFGFGDGFYAPDPGNVVKFGEALCSVVAGDEVGDRSNWVPFRGRTGTAACTNLNRRVKENDTIHKLNLTYRFDDDHMIYATWSEGFRPGGINRVGSEPPYTADYLTNYEIGWKTSWAGNRLRFNGAIFKQDWEDFQYSFLGQSGLTIIRNAAQAAINGIEADLAWAVSRDFMVSIGAAYTDAELDANYCGEIDANGRPVTQCAEPLAPKGTQLPITPKFKGNVTARYEFPLGSFEAHVQGALVYQDSVPSDLIVSANELLGEQASYTLIDLAAGMAVNSLSFELFINNVTDEIAETTRTGECAAGVCGRQPYIYFYQPRTYGLKFGQQF